MIQNSTIASGNYEEKKRINLPRTEQIRFNGQLNNIAKKYRTRDPILYQDLKAHICSEPLPTPVHCLPKDHKEGDLKGRPIHSATDTPSTELSKYLVEALKPLLNHVKAHLINTEDFIDFLSNIDEKVYGFCSLDVKNLYGSIPLEDVNDKTPGVFTVTKRFFEKHKSDCRLSGLSGDDFESLVRLCLLTDTILIDGKGYHQKSGLAMGNNLAPTLAIIYMNELDEQIIQKSGGAVSLKRFIDDIFAVLTSDRINEDKLLEISNSLSDAIKFTIELPEDNKLPFLDTLVSLDHSNNKFSTELYVKPIHSQSITPWDSHGSVSSKRGIVVGEIKRAMACSTDKKSERRSIRKIIKIFRSNGYPKRFLTSVVRRTTRDKHNRKEKNPNTIYLKLPFVNEQLKRRALSVIRNTGIGNIKTSFVNGLPLARVFAPPKESLDCKQNCETCSMALKSNQCLKKNVVYRISCGHCDLKYIGETGRTVGSRIKEHLKMSKQTVYVHLKSHGVNPQEGIHIIWEIIHNNVKHYNERKTIEAIEIQKCSQHLMNGCIGRIITI